MKKASTGNIRDSADQRSPHLGRRRIFLFYILVKQATDVALRTTGQSKFANAGSCLLTSNIGQILGCSFLRLTEQR